MTLIKNWNKEDILTMAMLPKMNWQILFKTIDDFDSLQSLKSARNTPAYISKKIKQECIFEESLETAKNKANNQLEICDNKEYNIITFWDEKYPQLLKEMVYPPAILYIQGELQPSDSVSISIVGTRRNTMYGKISAERFAEFFATRSIVITSGLAYGIDTISHLSAMKVGGITYAVIASGLDCLSSYYQSQTAKKIIDSGGAIISEYPCGVKALTAYFPQRNRIISGISKATIIVESARKGGALITARYAFEQQREVFAIPGRLSDLKNEGCNRLIKKNIASPALSPEEIFEELGFNTDKQIFDEKSSIKFDSATEEKVFETINMNPMQIDEIAIKSGLDISELNVKLLEMEFKGLIKSLPGKHYIRL